MSLACPHCGSTRPAIVDAGYRNACPQCGGPRLPDDARFLDEGAARAGTAALIRAKAKGDRMKWSGRLRAVAAALLSLSAIMSIAAGHIPIFAIMALLFVGLSAVVTSRQKNMIRAHRTRSDLDEAYALAGMSTAPALAGIGAGPGAHLRVMVEADTPERAQAEADARARAEAEAELEKEDTFADFDRRLAAAQKKD